MAIAFDNAVDGGQVTSNSLSWSHVSTGSDLIGFVGFDGETNSIGTDDVSSVTWAGNVCSFLAKKTSALTNSRIIYLYYIINPPTGSQTVAVTFESSHNISAVSASYTGAAQSSQPDASTTNASPSNTSTTLTTSLTTGVDNAWAVLLEGGYDGGTAPTAGTGSMRRIYQATFGELGFFDSNGLITPAGSYSMTTDRSVSSISGIEHVMASFKPSVAVSTRGTPFGNRGTAFNGGRILQGIIR